LKQVLPSIRRVAVIFNPDTAPHSIFLPALEAAAPSFAVDLIHATVRDTAAIESAIATLAREPDGGLLVMPDVFVANNRKLIYKLSDQYRVPTVYPFRYHAADGGLMSYGPDIVDQSRQAASYVDRILKGEKPSDLPVQAPTKYQLVINLKTAKILDLTIPPTVLALADEVIE
jgi:putative tryptophan/tyrosine transport system substrate-binding protein